MAGQGAPLCPLVSAVLARGVRTEITRFFYAAEIAAAKMLLFLRKSAAMDILTIWENSSVRLNIEQVQLVGDI